MIIMCATLKGAALEAFVSDLCLALSVLQGQAVNWIYWGTFTRRRLVESAAFGGKVTKEFGAPPLCFRPPCPPLELGFSIIGELTSKVKAFRDTYDPNNRLIKAWLDSRTEGDFLEARTLKCVVVMEMLTSIIDGAGGKRSVFRDRLTTAAGRYGIQLEKEDLDCFVRIRNQIVHTGGYDTNAQLPKVWQFPERPVWAFHFFVADFVDRFVLQLFGLREHLP